MARSRHVPTETAETTVLRPALRSSQRRRAHLEWALQEAIADGDAVRADTARQALALLENEEEEGT